MAQQPKTGTAEVVSMRDFLAKARKLTEAKPLDAPRQQGKTRNHGAATRKQWSRETDAREEQPADADARADPPDEAPNAD